MALVDKLEKKYGWIAIPSIVRILVGFQLLMFFLVMLGDTGELLDLLVMDPRRVLQGEVWRLASFVVIPPTLKVISMIFHVFFTIFLGDILERAWGSFRLTLYVAGGIVGIILGTFFAYFVLGNAACWEFMMRSGLVPLGQQRFIWMTVLLLAVAALEPNYVVNLFGILPVKMLWLGLFAGGVVCLDLILLAGTHLLLPISLLLAIANFLIVFGPSTVREIRQRSEVAARRQKFESSKMPADESLHRCANCGKTEHDDAGLEFRVAADGEEYCEPHLPSRSTD
ncbi:MAG: hypothetical protein ACI8XO_002774 [Verrucomicrobiales bacterium]|jgi:hypothetical protein